MTKSARAASGHAAAPRDELPPSDAKHGLPLWNPLGQLRTLSLPRKHRQVLGADLNCSE
jgi:hypothetical protein